MAIANYEDRFDPRPRTASTPKNAFDVRAAAASFGNGCSDGSTRGPASLAARKRTVPIKAVVRKER